MPISQKCQYGLRAIFELAKRRGQGPIKVAEIAEAQAIPPRFLEVILGQLKQGKFVASRRGAAGGYELIRPPDEVTVGDIIRYIEGPMGPVGCIADADREDCPLYGDCVFLPMWERAHNAVAAIYDATSFSDLVEEEKRKGSRYVPGYSI